MKQYFHKSNCIQLFTTSLECGSPHWEFNLSHTLYPLDTENKSCARVWFGVHVVKSLGE